jgi:hypothetical protein
VRLDTVPNGDDDVQIVVLDLAFDYAVTLGLNYPEFPDSCLAVKLKGVLPKRRFAADAWVPLRIQPPGSNIRSEAQGRKFGRSRNA